jgi:hypothetical protein
MKPKKLKTLTTFLLLLPLCVVLLGSGCEDEYYGFVEGYVVGSFICYEVDNETGQATGDFTERGYCILLEDSKNADIHWPMDFYTFDIPQGLIDIPEGVLSNPIDYDGSSCGPSFFPDSLQTEFKIGFEYMIVKEVEKNEFACGACTHMHLTFNWGDYNQIFLKNVSRIN